MKFLSLVIALLIEQARPLRHGNALYLAYRRYTETLERQLNGGEYRQGVFAWILAVTPATALVAAGFALLKLASPLLAIAWGIVVLYFTMGFRQFSHYYTDILQALRDGDVAGARDRLAMWRGGSTAALAPTGIARVAIELGLTASHRHVFGPILWFVLVGPAGAVVYRIAALLADDWGERAEGDFTQFGRFARRAFYWLDWLPARLTAMSFAVVGNFEDAVYCWRTQASTWKARARDVILASGGGALGVRLGGAVQDYDAMELRAELGTGDEPDADHMQSAVGLIWRALVLWVFFVFLVTVARAF